MKVEFKSGYQGRIDAATAWSEVEKIRKANNGDVAPENVVKAAKAKRNPLHGEFEWDDSIAANEHRLEQARKMLRSFVVIRDDTKAPHPQRVMEVTRKPKTTQEPARNVYRTVDDIMADPDTRAELLARALRELLAVRRRYRDLQELAVVMRSIDELLETIEA